MKLIAIKLFVLAFLASAAVATNADEGGETKDEKTPATSKVEIANKNGASKKGGEDVSVSEANAMNQGRQLESGSTAAPMNEKDYEDGKPLSE